MTVILHRIVTIQLNRIELHVSFQCFQIVSFNYRHKDRLLCEGLHRSLHSLITRGAAMKSNSFKLTILDVFDGEGFPSTIAVCSKADWLWKNVFTSVQFCSPILSFPFAGMTSRGVADTLARHRVKIKVKSPRRWLLIDFVDQHFRARPPLVSYGTVFIFVFRYSLMSVHDRMRASAQTNAGRSWTQSINQQVNGQIVNSPRPVWTHHSPS